MQTVAELCTVVDMHINNTLLHSFSDLLYIQTALLAHDCAQFVYRNAAAQWCVLEFDVLFSVDLLKSPYAPACV